MVTVRNRIAALAAGSCKFCNTLQCLSDEPTVGPGTGRRDSGGVSRQPVVIFRDPESATTSAVVGGTLLERPGTRRQLLDQRPGDCHQVLGCGIQSLQPDQVPADHQTE